MDAYFIPGGLPYLRTKKLALGALPFESLVTLWTNPDSPSDIAIKGAVDLVTSDASFRAEVELRLFEDYTEYTREEYLGYANDPAYEITLDMLPLISRPDEVWTVFHALEHAASIHEPDDMYPSDVAELVLSFGASFDKEHDFNVVFKDGKFHELTR